MIRFLLVPAAALLLAACTPSTEGDLAASVTAAAAPASPALARKTKVSGAGAAEVPTQIVFPSSVGEVTFQHQAHAQDRAIACGECHHQINAKQLTTPHADYLGASWINCTICHHEPGKVRQSVYACSECHPTNPAHIADETLSAKVVTHRQCWKCHEVSTGKDASASCELCHSGKKTI